MIGVTDADLKSIKVPTLIIPAATKTHGNAIGDVAKRLIPNSELHKVMGPDMDVDLGSIEAWTAKDDEIAALFDSFLRRALQPAAARNQRLATGACDGVTGTAFASRQSEIAVSRTCTVPWCVKPSCCAAARDRSRMRPRTYGPRSLRRLGPSCRCPDSRPRFRCRVAACGARP